jgi:DNA-binding NarL/FixJ family response regulator
MSNKLKFIWIDDDNSRVQAAKNLEKQLGVKCIFINVQPENVDYLSPINDNKPDLILVDHNLTEIGTGDIKKGSTIAALIREKHPNYAIACITGQDQPIEAQQRLSYEAIFSMTDIEKHYETMKAIAKTYRKLNAKKPRKADGLISLLKPPQEDEMKLKSILPQEIKENFKDTSLLPNISHWVRNILFKRPGFLYDRIWTATYLGLTETGFGKVQNLFEAAKYKGVFADESQERWWKSRLLEILSKHVKTTGLPWEKGRELPSINSRNYSKDYYSNYKEEFPETVAFLDESSEQRFPMKLKYTVPHPKYDKLLYFEDLKMMKAD